MSKFPTAHEVMEKAKDAEVFRTGDGARVWYRTYDELADSYDILQARLDKALAVIYATPQGWAAPVLEDAIHEIRMILEGKSDE